MKLLIFSDSHGLVSPMVQAVRAQAPDLVVHLGDCVRDAEALRAHFPRMALVNVRGNCDPGSGLPLRAEFDLAGVHVFACHGHSYAVKTGLDALLNAGHFAGADLVLFGHTHAAVHLHAAGMEVLNPGPAGQGCALAEIDDTGGLRCQLLHFSRER